MFVHMPSILESPKHGVESSHSSYTVESNALVVKPKLPRRGFRIVPKLLKKKHRTYRGIMSVRSINRFRAADNTRSARGL
jgi:hypothetical protein